MVDETNTEAPEQPEKTTTVFIPAEGFRKSVSLGVNGLIVEMFTGDSHALTDAQVEALTNSGIQFTVSPEGAPDGRSEGSAPSGPSVVNEGGSEDGDRTEPHQGEEAGDAIEATPPGTLDAGGNPVLIGGDETDPKDHSDDPAPADFVPENPQEAAEQSGAAGAAAERAEEEKKEGDA